MMRFHAVPFLSNTRPHDLSAATLHFTLFFFQTVQYGPLFKNNFRQVGISQDISILVPRARLPVNMLNEHKINPEINKVPIGRLSVINTIEPRHSWFLPIYPLT